MGSRGRAPGLGVRGLCPLKLTSFFSTRDTYFAVKLVTDLPILSNAKTFKIGYINQVDVDSLHITMQLILIDLVWMRRGTRAFTAQSTNDRACEMEVSFCVFLCICGCAPVRSRGKASGHGAKAP